MLGCNYKINKKTNSLPGKLHTRLTNGEDISK
jgi:hypothetical protein